MQFFSMNTGSKKGGKALQQAMDFVSSNSQATDLQKIAKSFPSTKPSQIKFSYNDPLSGKTLASDTLLPQLSNFPTLGDLSPLLPSSTTFNPLIYLKTLHKQTTLETFNEHIQHLKRVLRSNTMNQQLKTDLLR